MIRYLMVAAFVVLAVCAATGAAFVGQPSMPLRVTYVVVFSVCALVVGADDGD